MLRQLDLSDLIESSREDVLSASLDVDPTNPSISTIRPRI